MKDVQEKTEEFLRDLWLAVPYLQVYQMVDWMILSLSCVGIVISLRNRFLGLFLLTLADLSWFGYDLSQEEYAQAILFLFYSFVTAWGCYREKRN